MKLQKISLILPFAFLFVSHLSASQLSENKITLDTKDSIYSIVEKMPEFQGGEKALITFLNQTITYPAKSMKKKEQGKVIVQFVISKNGKVENAKILRSVTPSLDNEALRVIGLLPDWIPGEQDGEKVTVSRTIPVLFQIPSEESLWDVTEKTLVVIDGVKMPIPFNISILNPNKLLSVEILKPFPKEEKSKLISQYGKQAGNGVVLIATNKYDIYYALADTTNNLSKDENINCDETASIPQFSGGNEKLLSIIADSIQYPFVAKELKTQGDVIVRFKVNENGKISDAQVVKSLDYFLDKEALRVVNTLPEWKPSTKCGHNISIYVTMPVSFKLDLPADEKIWQPTAKTIVLLDGERLPISLNLSWLNYANLLSYKVLQPGAKDVTKKLVKEYGKDAVNGVILIESKKQ